MATSDIVKRNGDSTNLPVNREETSSLPAVYSDMQRWMDQWNRLFDSMFSRAVDMTPFRGMEVPGWSGWNRPGSFVPAVNITETDSEYKLTAELPGIDEKDIDISLGKDTLTIKGEKKEETEDKGKGYYRMERSYGTFQRTIPLPPDVDPDKVNATFKKGVLTLHLPKSPEQAQSTRKISVRSEDK